MASVSFSRCCLRKSLCAWLATLILTFTLLKIHIFWMKIALFLGYINSRILLTLIYYGMFTPYGLISRLVGRDPLMRRNATQESYWTERKTTRQSTESFERLF
ncbi:MAG TPA: SxtJ family membrane protein [Pyrinomonadaceae bacterium]|nr:SxtJ family membrane protein [Pyrinomonadaceae bacterium]